VALIILLWVMLGGERWRRKVVDLDAAGEASRRVRCRSESLAWILGY
jgi:hypothetical protein